RRLRAPAVAEVEPRPERPLVVELEVVGADAEGGEETTGRGEDVEGGLGPAPRLPRVEHGLVREGVHRHVDGGAEGVAPGEEGVLEEAVVEGEAADLPADLAEVAADGEPVAPAAGERG